MFFVRQGATHKIVIGPVVAVGDGFTPVTTLSVATADEAEAILHDNGTVVDISGYTFAAITTADGYYHLTLQSGISGTVGHVTIVINDDSLCLPVKAEFTVIEESIYDAMFAASANAFQGAAGSTKVTGVVLVDTLTTYTGNTVQTGDAFARLGAPAGASVSVDIAAVKTDTAAILVDTNELQTDWANGGRLDLIVDAILVDTAEIGAAGAGLTDIGGFSTTAKGQIQTEAEDALQSHHVVLVKTTIATLASQTSFTLTAGSADNDAYNGCEIVIEDAVTVAQKAVGVVSDYTGITKTVTLLTDPAVFTMAVGDVVTIRPSRALKAAVDNRTILVNASGHVERVTLNDTTTTNTDMRGTDSAALASVCTEARLAELDAANLPAGVDAILLDTGTDGVVVAAASKTGYALSATGLDLVTTWTVAITGNVTGNLSGSVGSVTGTVGGVAGTITTLDALDTAQDTQHSTTQTSVSGIWTTALTEAYRATGATGTAAQLLYEILQNLTEFTIASTTKTVKKLDGTTTAKTYTLDDATTPTGITETT